MDRYSFDVELSHLLLHAGLSRRSQCSSRAVPQLLATDRYGAEVRDDERTAAALGISAVPFFVVDRAFGASGAQPPQALLELLCHVWAERAGTVNVIAEGAACGPQGC